MNEHRDAEPHLPTVAGLIVVDILIVLAPRQEWDHVRQVRKERSLLRASSGGPVRRVARADVLARPDDGAGGSGDRGCEEDVAAMAHAGVRRFPVQHAGKIAGIISDGDILRAVAERGGVG